MLIDSSSTNGTFVNGRRIDKPYILQQTDTIQIGPYQLSIERDTIEVREITKGLQLDGQNLKFSVYGGKATNTILENIDVNILPGEFVALVGPSGAGKSTLMRVLSGIQKPQTGQVLLNGNDLYKYFDAYRSIIGYVPQDDIIHKNLSVYSALKYAAQLRLPPDTTNQEIEERIESVLEQVQMISRKRAIISTLSGGERKRISISVELLAEPRLFFLDEPTSGLDPGLEKSLMKTLRNLADLGKTIILVTHATANITECDLVCFLVYGQQTYFGPPSKAHDYFDIQSQDHNFADIYELFYDRDPSNCKKKATQLSLKFKDSDYYKRLIVNRRVIFPSHQNRMSLDKKRDDPADRQYPEKAAKPRVSSFRQFKILSQRYLEIIFRDKLLLTTSTLIMPIIGVLLLVISKSNWLTGDSLEVINNALNNDLARATLEGKQTAFYSIVGNSQILIFMLALSSVLLGLFASSFEIVKERSIFLRERTVGLRLLPYYLSKLFILGLIGIIQCLLLLLVIHLKITFPTKGVILFGFGEMLVTLILGTIAAIALGLLISSLLSHNDSVIYFLLGILIYQIIFAGVIFDLPSTIGPIVSGFTITRWSIEGLGSTIGMNSLNQRSKIRYDPSEFSEEIQVQIQKPNPNNPTELVDETVNKIVNIDPEPVEIPNERDFFLNYYPTSIHLWNVWIILLLFSLTLCVETLITLKVRTDR